MIEYVRKERGQKNKNMSLQKGSQSTEGSSFIASRNVKNDADDTR